LKPRHVCLFDIWSDERHAKKRAEEGEREREREREREG
jgi:hypothetical protein